MRLMSKKLELFGGLVGLWVLGSSGNGDYDSHDGKTIQPGFARGKCTPIPASRGFPRRGKF